MNCSHCSSSVEMRSRQRPVDRLDDVSDRDGGGRLGERVATARALVRGEEAAAPRRWSTLSLSSTGMSYCSAILARARRRRRPALSVLMAGASSPSRVIGFLRELQTFTTSPAAVSRRPQSGPCPARLHTTSTFASATPGTPRAASATWPGRICAAGHPGRRQRHPDRDHVVQRSRTRREINPSS